MPLTCYPLVVHVGQFVKFVIRGCKHSRERLPDLGRSRAGDFRTQVVVASCAQQFPPHRNCAFNGTYELAKRKMRRGCFVVFALYPRSAVLT